MSMSSLAFDLMGKRAISMKALVIIHLLLSHIITMGLSDMKSELSEISRLLLYH